jgi:meso-butanediol dehydrogenase/(S,S)-butanediol dehydrogenase/diacetyl reductase
MRRQIPALASASRLAAPQEPAAWIAFLASDDASFIHGVTLAVDGCRTAA